MTRLGAENRRIAVTMNVPPVCELKSNWLTEYIDILYSGLQACLQYFREAVHVRFQERRLRQNSRMGSGTKGNCRSFFRYEGSAIPLSGKNGTIAWRKKVQGSRSCPHVSFPGSAQRPRLTAFFNSAPGTNFVTFLAGIFKGAPVCGLRPVLALRELTEKVPKPTSVTLLPFFNVDTTPSIAEFRALLAWTFEIFESFAILSINSPLFICVLPPSELDYLSCHFCLERCGLYRTV